MKREVCGLEPHGPILSGFTAFSAYFSFVVFPEKRHLPGVKPGGSTQLLVTQGFSLAG
jgi:hypothetical protein